jgi:hypothetical protein
MKLNRFGAPSLGSPATKSAKNLFSFVPTQTLFS